MKAEQYEGLVGRLDAILSKIPAVPQPDPQPPFTVHHLDGTKTVTPGVPAREGNAGCGQVTGVHNHARCGQDDVRPLTGSALAVGARRALEQFLDVLNGWIEGAQENHEAMDHRDQDCCRTFHPDDIRRMVNDAAREVGLTRSVRVEKEGD